MRTSILYWPSSPTFVVKDCEKRCAALTFGRLQLFASEPVPNCRYQPLRARSNLRVRTILQNHGARHPGADQNVRGSIRQTNADRNTLRQPDPGEGRVYAVKKFGSVAVVEVGCPPSAPMRQRAVFT
jgi:hypothetical protein